MSFSFNLQSLQDSLQKTTQNLTTSLQENLGNLPSANEVSSSFQQNLNSLQKEVTNLKPILKRTQRSLQEKFGSTSDISELPQDYKDLEKQVDDLKSFYKRVLTITQQYGIESYDYPPNLKESINDYTKILNQKLTGLSQATTTNEAEAVLLSTTKDEYPKTFAHQLSKAFKKSHDQTVADNEAEGETSLTKAMLLSSNSEFKIGDERLEQDKLVISEFNSKVQSLLKNEIARTDRLRKQVETARLNFDATRAEIKTLQHGEETAPVPEKLSQKLENYEDELVNATEVAVEAMKDLVKSEEPLSLLKVYTKIQLNYHKAVVEELSSLSEDLGGLPTADAE